MIYNIIIPKYVNIIIYEIQQFISLKVDKYMYNYKYMYIIIYNTD